VKELRFFDLVETCTAFNHKSRVVIELIKLMQNEIDRSKDSAERQRLSMELNYNQLFTHFASKRKITLLRYLFTLPSTQFKFTIELFIKSLEIDACDIASLIFKEFFRLIRDVDPHDEEVILTSIVSSFQKSNGQIEFKCFLVRQFSERMMQRHARRLLDTLDTRLSLNSK